MRFVYLVAALVTSFLVVDPTRKRSSKNPRKPVQGEGDPISNCEEAGDNISFASVLQMRADVPNSILPGKFRVFGETKGGRQFWIRLRRPSGCESWSPATK